MYPCLTLLLTTRIFEQMVWCRLSRPLLQRWHAFLCAGVENLWPPSCWSTAIKTLQWRHNGRDSVSNHQPHDCFLKHLFRHRSKKTSKLRVTGLCVGNSPEAGEFPAKMASNAEKVSIWWRHHGGKDTHGRDWLKQRLCDNNLYSHAV